MTIALAHYEWMTDAKTGRSAYVAPAGVLGSIDLRTTEQCGTPDNAGDGFTIFDFAADAHLPAEAVVLGSLGDSLDPRTRDLALSAIGSKTQGIGGTVADFLYELMTLHSDPFGEANHQPLMPTVARSMEVWLSGIQVASKKFDLTGMEAAKVRAVLQQQFIDNKAACAKGDMPPQQYLKVLDYEMKKLGVANTWCQPDGSNEQPISHSTTVTDNFNRADGAIGGSWGAISGTWTVASNGAGKTATGSTDQLCRLNSDLSSADNYAQLTTVNAGASTGYGPVCRLSASAASGYLTYNFTGTVYLFKAVAGTYTSLGSTANTLSAGQVFKVSANGTTITNYINGSQKTSVSDSAVSGNLRTGVYQYAAASPTFDDFQAGDLSVSTNYSLTAAQGSFSLTGQSALFPVARKVTAAQGSFSLSGQAASFPVARKLTAGVGSFALTGINASLVNSGAAAPGCDHCSNSLNTRIGIGL